MREFSKAVEFRKYLENLEGEKPFECSYLRVLPEEIKNSSEMTVPYEKGALICIGTVGSVGPIVQNNRCHFRSNKITLDEEGNLEVICGWNGGLFKLSVKDFQPKKS